MALEVAESRETSCCRRKVQMWCLNGPSQDQALSHEGQDSKTYAISAGRAER